MLRATQPAGAVFALGWVMAELFDPRRRVSVTVRTPPFDPDTQLPLVADLAADPKLIFLAAELSELLHRFPHLHRPLRLVINQTDRKKVAVAAESLVAVTGLHLAIVQTLLSGAGVQLPSGTATMVSRSLSNWADWIDGGDGARLEYLGPDQRGFLSVERGGIRGLERRQA